MIVRALRSFAVNGRHISEGEIVEIESANAVQLIAIGRCIESTEQAKELPEKATRKK